MSPLGLCDRCLGRRLVGAAGETAQCQAGAKHRAEAGWPDVAQAECSVCEGAFADLDAWSAAARQALAPYEFATFQVGTIFPAACEDAERAAAAVLAQEVGETVRTEANRLLAPALAAATGAQAVAEGRPDVVVTVDTRFWHAEARANSLFIAGRYTKHRRDIPQTHWPCKRCQGRGCWECDDAGVMYAESVEDAIAGPAKAAFAAAGASFHGAGREDIDALMLGTGRPFVLELHDPRRRRADLGALAHTINAATAQTGVGVTGQHASDKAEVVRIKAADYDKEYLAHCLADAPLARAAVQAAVARLSGATLKQRTPGRVSHRRADLVRERTVHRITMDAMEADPGKRFSLSVLAESGTYIKELVSGDDGRTEPSLTGLLGVPCKVEHLDVMAILDGDPPSPLGPKARSFP